jgi:hypothetical protein
MIVARMMKFTVKVMYEVMLDCALTRIACVSVEVVTLTFRPKKQQAVDRSEQVARFSSGTRSTARSPVSL